MHDQKKDRSMKGTFTMSLLKRKTKLIMRFVTKHQIVAQFFLIRSYYESKQNYYCLKMKALLFTF